MRSRHMGFAALAGVFLLGGALSACARTVDAVGGETNWLVLCSTDGDCTQGSCMCGVCTRSCEATDDCIDPQSGVCRGSNTLEVCDSAPSGATPAPARMCLPPCGAARGCGEGFACRDHACVPEASSSSVGSTGSGGEGVPDAGTVDAPGTDGTTAPTPLEATGETITIHGEAFGTLGSGNAIVGDLDADGYDDLVLMDYGGSGAMADLYGTRGAAYLFYGRPTFEPMLEAAQADAILRGGSEVVRALSDLNGDGFDDFAFASGAGIHVVFGGSRRLAGELVASDVGVLLTVDGIVDNVELSHTFVVNSAGDVDGDGSKDLIAMLWADGSDGVDTSRVFLVDGAAIGTSGRVDVADPGVATILDLGPGQGTSCSGAGDIDGDGYGDLLINFDEGQGARGGLLYGSEGFLDRPHAYAEAAAMWDRELLWATLGTAGDLDGDAYDDFVAGHETMTGVFYGGRSRRSGALSIEDADFVVRPEGPEAYLAAIAFGDIDGDGMRDALIGDPHQSRNGSQAGALYAVRVRGRLGGELQLGEAYALRYGGGGDGAAGADAPSPDDATFALAEDLGYGTASGGDVNADGFDDILVGALGDHVGDEFGGATYLILGSN